MTETQALGQSPRPSHGPSGRRFGITIPTEEGPLVFATLPEAADFFGLPHGVVRNRLGKGQSERQAFGLDPPPPKKSGNRKPLSFDFKGIHYEYASLTAAAIAHDMTAAKVGERMYEYGWTPAQSLGLDSPPPRRATGKAKPVQFLFEGKQFDFPSVLAAAKSRGLTAAAVRNRRYRSEWTWPQCLGLEPPPGCAKYCYGMTYVVTHLSTGKQYIGQTLTSIDKRWASHVSSAYRRTPRNEKSLAAAIRTYGPTAFSIELVEIAHSQHELNRMEQRLICNYDTRVPYGFNISRGGGGFARRARVTIGGKRYASYAEAARTHGVALHVMYKRLEDGLTPEQAVGLAQEP